MSLWSDLVVRSEQCRWLARFEAADYEIALTMSVRVRIASLRRSECLYRRLRTGVDEDELQSRLQPGAHPR
jgi:hypothetical protein